MPLVNRTFDQLIDFTRTSAATFVNSSGNIASTPQSRNLLTFTQEFDNAAWTKTNTTITANSTAAPDGTSTADTLTASAGAAVHNVGQNTTISGVACTWSIYAKAGTSSFLQLVHTANSNFFANFNLATGAVGTVGSLATAAITSVGNGWYRCSMTFTPTSGSLMRAAMISSATAVFNESWTAAGTETIFLWGAQLEQASAVTDYTRNFGGLFPPRFDYDPVTRAPRGLLIEEQRTNLFTYSEQFDNAAWAKTNATVTANSTTSPDGTVDADTLVEDTANSTHRISQGFSGTSGTSYTFTLYAKASTRSWVALQFTSNLFGDGLARTAYVNLSTGAIGTLANAPTVVVTNAGNGWYRIAVTVAATATSASAAVLVYLANADNSASYTGDGTSGIFLYGAQLEAGAFATSYIPTVASQVTRTADTALIQAPMFASWYNSAEGTLLVEGTISPNVDSAVGNYYAAISDGTTSNTILIAEVNGSTSQVVTGGVIQFNETVGSEPTGTVKVALAYATNNTVSASNGTLGSTDTSVSIPTVNRLNIGSRGDLVSTGFANGHIRSIRYYPARLSNAQLQALTA